jgi:elongation factor G
VINKLDRERSSFERALESVQSFFGRTAIPVHLPIGSEKDFKGVVDLVVMKAYTYTRDGDGKGKESDIPADMAEAAKAAHEALVEMVAEGNDAYLEGFFDTGTLPVEHIHDGLREAIRQRRMFPVLCASGLHNIASDLILNFAFEYFPDPAERGPWKGTLNGADKERAVKDSEPLSIFVFKTIADPFAGRVSYFKVVSGILRNDANLVNARNNGGERLSHIGTLLGKAINPITELHAGDVGGVAKLKDTLTGDTLADKASLIAYPAVQLPEPSIAYAISAKTRNDEDRMGNAFH